MRRRPLLAMAPLAVIGCMSKTTGPPNIATIRAKNPDARVIGFTLLPSTSVTGSEDVERLAHNADMTGAWGAAVFDQVLDVASIPELSNPANATYYADGTHLNAVGQPLISTKYLNEVAA